ncbi:hypothetical protein [Salmonirosea aquatica]|uniref:Uncharacterized protein n=1 Tax=Salmonirosea aquatica TaxID=2654236 RepID=A0A7C9B9D7_9BACT|nr:hypothetical protein [Cytophagaceae bacterium SJW1-29]
MEKRIKSLLWLALAVTLLTCKPDKIEPDPLTDGKPRILSISFPGIPRKDVSIDQRNLVITIKVPPVLLSDMEPSVELTENAQVFNSWPRVFIGQCKDCQDVLVGFKGTRDYDATVYKIKLIPSSPFEVGVMGKPVEYVLYNGGSGFHIPAINLYANAFPKSAKLINRMTKEVINIDSSRIYAGWEQQANNLFIHLTKFEPTGQRLAGQAPGTYDIELKMADGKTIRTPQPLILVKGPAYLSSYEEKTFYGQEARVNSTFFMEGYNLFEGDIVLELTDRHGVKTPLDNLTFEPYGLRLGITLPNTMVPGQYVMRLYQFGKDQGFCFRLNVRAGNAPAGRIGTIGDDAMPCSLQEPVRIGRSQAVPITYNLTQNLPNRPRIKLTPTSDPSKTFYGSVLPIVLAPNPLGPGRLTIGSEVPTGLYTAVLQYLDTDGKIVLETDPYGQLLEVY